MARDDSSRSRATIKATKAPLDFPLNPHWGSGQWRKTIGRRDYYFGKIDDWEAALAKFKHDLPYLKAGVTPPPMPSTDGSLPAVVSAHELANRFLDRELTRHERGKLGLESYTDTRRAMADLLAFFGRDRDALTILPADWARFRHWMETSTGTPDAPRKPLGPDALDRRIGYIRSCSAWASGADVGLLPRRLLFGDEFNSVPRSEIHAARRARKRRDGRRSFSRDEVAKILATLDREAAVWTAAPADLAHLTGRDRARAKVRAKLAITLRAMVLLGLNGGYYQSDASELRVGFIDFDQRLIDHDREKTGAAGAARIVALWKRTADALRAAIAIRPAPRDPAYAGHVFLTRLGLPYQRATVRTHDDGRKTQSKRDAIGEEFAKLLRRLGLKRPGVSFKGLRKTFYQAAGVAGDPEARDVMMGHQNATVGEWYEEGEEDMIERVRAVARVVRRRLFKRARGTAGPAAAAAPANAAADGAAADGAAPD